MKKHFFSAFLIFFQFFLNALPGFKPYIMDFPGDYVFYRDYSFKNESYVGFLYYGNSAYSAKFISPQNQEQGKPEKSVSIYFTVDESKNFMEFTGEKVVSLPGEEDIQLVNYLHDLIYEFSAKRISVQDVNAQNVSYNSRDFLHSGLVQNAKFEQFGGDVKIIFDYAVPLFNIKAILNFLDEVQFEIVTAGRISSEKDNEFEKFSGFSDSDSSSGKMKIKKSKKKEFSFENVKVVLDENWVQKMENIWFLSDSAFVCVNKISQPQINIDFIFRQMLLNTENSFYDWKNFIVQKEKDYFTIDGTIYNAQNKRKSKNLIKILSAKENPSEFYAFNSSVLEKAYKKNEKYFNSIRDSFSLNEISE